MIRFSGEWLVASKGSEKKEETGSKFVQGLRSEAERFCDLPMVCRLKNVGAPTMLLDSVVHIGGRTTCWAAVARGAAESVPFVSLRRVRASTEEEEVKEAKDANAAFGHPPPPCFCVCRGNKGVSVRESEEKAKSKAAGRSEMAQEQRPLSITREA